MSNLKTKATKAASRFLERCGYDVLETGWKCAAGTTDIVAEDGDVLVFVDVSARDSIDRGFPTESCSQRAARWSRWRTFPSIPMSPSGPSASTTWRSWSSGPTGRWSATTPTC